MKMKPVILILTSSDISEQIPKQLKQSIDAFGTYYVVVFDEAKYEAKLKFNNFDKLQWLKLKYMKKDKKDNDTATQKKKEQKGRNNRIYNAVLRFKPDCIVCLSAYAHLVASEAKKRTGFETPIIALIPNFTADKSFFDLSTDAFIVENEDAKAEVVKMGLSARSIVALGLPLDIKVLSDEEKSAVKVDFGLSKATTVFLNCRNKKDCIEIFDMLLDQGNLINIVAYCPKKDTFAELRKLVDLKSSDNVQLFDKKANFDEYLAVSDIVISYYSVATIYKSFILKLPVITFPPRGEMGTKDLKYLEENELIYCAKDLKDIIIGLYKIIQTNLAQKLKNNIEERKIENNIENIAEFIVGFGK